MKPPPFTSNPPTGSADALSQTHAPRVKADANLEVPPPQPKLLDSLRHAIRRRRYSIRTEEAYVDWARRSILFHGKRHPRDLDPEDITAFLTNLAVQRQVAPSTQNQARSALLFMYREVLQLHVPWLDEATAAKSQRRRRWCSPLRRCVRFCTN